MVFTNYYKGIYEPCPFFNIVNDEKPHYFIDKIVAVIKEKATKE